MKKMSPPKDLRKQNKLAAKAPAIPSQMGNYLTQLGYAGPIAPDQVIFAIATYLAHGTAKATQELTGTTSDQLAAYKAADWYPKIVELLRQEQQDKLDSKLSNILDKTVEVIDDRLSNGDYVFTKEGLQQIPVNASTAAKLLNTIFDKRALGRGEATKITQEKTSGLQYLEDVLKKIAKEKQPEKVIPGEATRIWVALTCSLKCLKIFQ